MKKRIREVCAHPKPKLPHFFPQESLTTAHKSKDKEKRLHYYSTVESPSK